MRHREGMHRDGSVLAVVPLNVKLQLMADLLRVYSGCHVIVAFVEQRQDALVNIVVNEDNPTLRTFHQTTDQLVGIVYLSFEEDALHRWQRRAHKEVNFLLGAAHALLQPIEPLADGVALEQVLLQHAVGPLAEHRSVDAVDAITDRENGIKIVEFRLIKFSVSGSIFQNGIN